MSLINEALKKARIEAAQRDAEQRGVLVPKAAAYAPRRRTGRLVAAALAACAALGLAAAGGMWLARRGSAGGEVAQEASAGTTETSASVRESAAGATGAGAGMPAGGGLGAGGGGAGAGPAPATRGGRGDAAADGQGGAAGGSAPGAGSPTQPTGRAASSAEASAGLAQPRPGSAPATEPAPPRAPATAPPPRTAPPARRPQAAPPTPEDGHLREAPLPGGGSIRLDGIVWSETHPAAVIEGQVVGPGEYVRGARLLRVERDRVVLEADGGEIVVRLR